MTKVGLGGHKTHKGGRGAFCGFETENKSFKFRVIVFEQK